MPLCPPSSTGIDDTPFVDTWHGKPSDALPPQQSSAGNGAFSLIDGLPSKPFNARSASAYSCCVAVHRCASCRFQVIAVHLRPQSIKPLTQKSSVIPSGIMVCCHHKGGGRNETIILIVARVEGISPMLPILEGGASCMPLTFWAAQTKAASNLLGVGQHTSTFTCYISPTSAASSIQHAYRLYLIWQNCCILPFLRGPYKSRPSSNVATEEGVGS
jgi:hypothetical protein